MSDARVIAAVAIARCRISGQRLPQTELVRSTVTGQQVACELVVRCPVSGDFLMDTERVCCRACQQWGSPRIGQSIVKPAKCVGTYKPVDVEEAHVLPLLDRFPGLANWRSFRLGFSEDVMVLNASKGWQRRLLVVDRKTRCLRSAAGNPRFGGSCSPIDVQHLDQNI